MHHVSFFILLHSMCISDYIWSEFLTDDIEFGHVFESTLPSSVFLTELFKSFTFILIISMLRLKFDFLIVVPSFSFLFHFSYFSLDYLNISKDSFLSYLFVQGFFFIFSRLGNLHCFISQFTNSLSLPLAVKIIYWVFLLKLLFFLF